MHGIYKLQFCFLDGSSPKVVLDFFIICLTYVFKGKPANEYFLHIPVQRSVPFVKYMLW